MLAHQDDKGFLLEAHWRSSTSGRKIGDMITADHKSSAGECRNNHPCAVVVQDIANQWTQSDPCKTKTSQETDKSSRKFLEQLENPSS